MQRKTNKRKTKSPLKAYGYVRVSTEDQAKEGLSIEAQKEKIKAFATLHDLDLVETIVDEGYSGKDLKRPGVQKLLQLTNDETVEAVIVYKLDRLSRKTRDLLKLIEDTFAEGNTRFFSISEQIDTKTAIGKFFLTLMGALAQMERELIAERTKSTLQHKKSKGEHLGQIPYGYRVNEEDKLVRDDEEYKIVRKMRRWKKAGKSYREIARLLNEQGVPTKKEGAKWYHTSVSSILS